MNDHLRSAGAELDYIANLEVLLHTCILAPLKTSRLCRSLLAVTWGRMCVAFAAESQPVSSRSKNARVGADISVRFLQLSDAIRGFSASAPLDTLQARILAWVARAGLAGERLCVRDIMAKDELGAPATIHSRLKSMREKGWIVLADTDDSRRKQVELSDDALRHFAQLSKAMVRAANGA